MKKIISLLLTAALIVTSGGNVVFAEEDTSKEPSSSAASARPEQMQSGLETIVDEEQTDPDQIVTAIIELEDEPLISKAEGMKNSDIYSSENKETLLSKQRSVQKKISGKVLDGQSLEVVRSYTVAANGFAAKVPYGKLDDIRKISGVASVYVAPEFKVAPNMNSSISAIGGMENTSGYNGEGTVIAIVDTGLETSHEAFRAAPISPSLTKDDITAVLQKNDLHAEESVNGLTASQVYRSAKIPFAFDYADDDTDVAPGSAGDHGTHVAGIASANAGVQADVSGVASQSQLLVMKVFGSGASNGATWDDILAALDDAVCLGADVINMSLGSTAGFASIEADEGVSAVYQRVTDAGIMLAVAGGNEYSSAFGNMMGKGHALAQNPDYGTIASPSSYNASMAVASVDRADVIQSYYFTAGTRKIAFNDTAEDQTVSGVDENSVRFRSLSGAPVSYTVIPGYGETKDYEGADVSGKIALVSRGNVDYAAKKKAAKAAGAAGIIVYNNEPGMLFMQLDSYDFPAAFISQADGQWLCDQAGKVQLNIANSQGSIDSPTSGQMSDFSSWGVTPELTLKPDITAPGGNIKSTITGNSYGTKSGTSMASPYVAGAMAVVKQYVEHKLAAEADSETEKADLVNSIIMSTADIVYEENGTPYSPRKQGAGSVNVDRAVRSSSYVTVPGMKLPKIELGDDVEKTGVYTMSAVIHNHSDKAVTYKVGGTVQTDGAEITKQYKGKDVWQNTERPYKLEASVVGNDVTVEAGKTANVQVTVTLTESDKAYMDKHFENGIYVEGFIVLTPKENNDVTLSVPYMGFYGDWTKASVIDRGYYWNDLNDEENWATQYTNTAGVSSLEGNVTNYLGDNPYHQNIPYLSDRNAISPNNDDTMDALDILYTGLLRNVKQLKYSITGEDGTVYYEKSVDYEIKSVYDSSYYRIVPSGVQDYSKMEAWYGTDKQGRTLANGTKATVKIECELPYDKHVSNNENLSWEFPITIDTEEPAAEDITVREENGAYYVSLKVSDNEYVSNICFANANADKQLGSYPVAETEPGKTTEAEYNVTGYGEKLTVIVNDYAGNRKEYKVTVEGNTDDSEIIVPTKSVFEEDFEEDVFKTDGWSLKSQSSTTWKQSYEYGSNLMICDYANDDQNEWLISPEIDLSAQETKASMIFDFWTNYYWSVQNHHHNLKVKASKDGGVTWTDIWQIWDVTKEFDAWTKTQAKVNIPEEFQKASNVKFAFVYEGADGTELALDNINVYVEDPQATHTITASAKEGGVIEPSGKIKISDGKSKEFKIVPDEGNAVLDVKVDGVSVGAVTSYKFENVTEDHSIEAEFAVSGTAGTAETLIDEDFDSLTIGGAMPEGWTLKRVNSNETWRIYKYYSRMGLYCSADTYDPDSGSGWWSKENAVYPKNGDKQDEKIILPAADLSGGKAELSYQFTGNKSLLKSGAMTCSAEVSNDGGNTWTEIWNAKNAVDSMQNGVVSSYVGTADIKIQIPDNVRGKTTQIAFCYKRPALSEDGGPVFIDNVKLTATKSGSSEGPKPEPEEFTITASAGQGGNIDPSGTKIVKKGEDQTFTITASKNYEIDDVKADGKSVGAKNSYTFKNVTENHTISASFRRVDAQLPESIHEDFNASEIPEGWSIEGPSKNYNYESWKLGRYSELNSSNSMICSQNIMFRQEQNEKLIMPQIKMADGMKLTFDFGGSYDELMSGSVKLTVKATLDKGAVWTEIWNAKEHIQAVEEGTDEPEDITGSGSVMIPAGYCNDNTRLAFVFESNDRRNATVAVDNVVLEKSGSAPSDMYAVAIAKTENGTVEADKTLAAQGTQINLTVTPDSGYKLKEGSLRANGAEIKNNSFIMPAENVTVTAAFEKKNSEDPAEGTYKDGTYRGSAIGYDGTVTVDVTIENGVIKDINVVEQNETESYWEKAEAIIEKLIGLGDDESIGNVDAVTGATVSSEAIQTAVLDALKNAKNIDSGIFSSGSGTKQDPYIVRTVSQMEELAKTVNAGETYKGKYIALGNNISAKGVTWIPVGSADHGKYKSFEGVFDGCGYTISDVSCGTASEPQSLEVMGIFGVLGNGAVVKNLNVHINKFYNDISTDGFDAAVGGIAGIAGKNAVIDHCSVSGGENALSSVESNVNSYSAGGIAGRLEAGGMIANCWSDIGISDGSLDMDADMKHYTGGICGKQAADSLIVNCASFGIAAVSVGDGDIHVGGIVGDASGSVYNCYSMSSTRGNNIVNSATNPTTAVGMLIGSTSSEKVLYNCYYYVNANQVVDFKDQASDEEEGKPERRKVVGYDSSDKTEADLTNVSGLSVNKLASEQFADTMNEGRKNAVKKAADVYFNSDISGKEDILDNGFLNWKLTGGRVLIEGTQLKEQTVASAELLKAIKVDYGTLKENIQLPETVSVKFDDGNSGVLSVTWKCDNYNAEKAGDYTFEGTLEMISGVSNPKNIKAYQVVTVGTSGSEGGSGGSGSGGSGGGNSGNGGGNSSGNVNNGSNGAGSGTPSTGNDKMPFTDVTEGIYYYDAVKWAVKNNITQGVSETLFMPDLECTRAQVVTFMWRAAGSPSPANKKLTFKDVDESAYYYDAVRWATQNGITQGTSESTFSPDRKVTRSQFVTFLWRSKNTPDAGSSNVFSDIEKGAYYYDAVLWAAQAGIAKGTSADKFSPENSCTRSQIVTFLYRAADNK